VTKHKSDVADFDISYALMAMARSTALNGDLAAAKEYFEKCKESIEKIKDPEDKRIVLGDFNAGPWYGLK
jgi:hypothetical protein